MAVKILQGDVRAILPSLPADSFDCVATSPPYWGLRNYGVDGQIGMERTLGEHIAVLVDVFREIRRVLKPTGTVWLNYGDCYAASPNGRSAADTKAAGNDDRTFRDKPFSTVGPILAHSPGDDLRGMNGKEAYRPGSDLRVQAGGFLKAKDLCMVSNRLAIALQSDGWWVRSEIIWHKPNPMPESTTDRPTSSHEKVWLLTKSARYFYDADAVCEVYAPASASRYKHEFRNDIPSASATKNPSIGCGKIEQNPLGRNLRNVWTIATAPFPDAHFATFPPELVERCIKAGTSEKGCCPKCGAPWERVLEKKALGKIRERSTGGMGQKHSRETHGVKAVEGTFQEGVSYQTVGWQPTCKCEPCDPVPCSVLDPFGGAGTTGLVADRLGRNATLIDLNPQYIEMALQRIKEDAPLFVEAASESWSDMWRKPLSDEQREAMSATASTRWYFSDWQSDEEWLR